MLSVFYVLVIAVGLYMAWNIGANDVANAMGTSVGSKVIKISTAIVLAGIFEFLGAFLVGSSVTNTIRKGIIDISQIPVSAERLPYIFMFGMLSALLGAAIWLQIATFFKLPVSTTHAIIGAIVGFGLLEGGVNCINWGKIAQIVLSWVISPVCGGVLSFLTFKFMLKTIIDTEDPGKNAKKWGPFLIGVVTLVLYLSLIFKGLKNVKMPFLKTELSFLGLDIPVVFIYGIIFSVILAFLSKLVFNRITYNSKDKYSNVEKIFGYLQIITACSVAFAHGANDVANATGPVSAVLGVLKEGQITSETVVLKWVLLAGGIGIVIGLATWGYKVIETIGHNITEITPSRGFAAELGASTTVLMCSQMGLPISTTHTLVGAVVGIGFARGLVAINTTTIKNIVYSWVITIPMAAIFGILSYEVIKYFFEGSNLLGQ